ncbi:hypothetical protein BTK97_002483 [Burkholderia multivorans]|nr:hypothetical protein [Burkholderia multivorans]
MRTREFTIDGTSFDARFASGVRDRSIASRRPALSCHRSRLCGRLSSLQQLLPHLPHRRDVARLHVAEAAIHCAART